MFSLGHAFLSVALMKSFILVLSLIIIFTAPIFAQNPKYRNAKYDWEPVSARAAIEDRYKNDDAVILDEETNVEMLHDIATPYNYYLTKKMRIRYQTEASLKKYNTITLPESFDPVSDYAKVAVSKRDSLHRPKGTYDFLLSFKTRIIKPDGSIVDPVIKEHVQQESFTVNAIERKYYAVSFTVKNLEVGDELDIRYRCKEEVDNGLHFGFDMHAPEKFDFSVVTYESNSVNYYLSAMTGDLQKNQLPYRMFFNGTLSKQHFKLSFQYKNNIEYYVISCFNGGTFNDSTTVGNTTRFTWERTNLDGCIMEPGSRNFKQLPYMVFYYHGRDFGKVNMQTGEVLQPWPYTWEAYFTSNVHVQDKKAEKIVENLLPKDHAYIVMRNYLKELKQSVGDTNKYKLVRAYHKAITENFNYQEDAAFIAGTDQRKERLGDFFEGKILRQISRNRIYRFMFFIMKEDYFTTRLYDKRVQELNFERYTPSLVFDTYFNIVHDQSVSYFLPKKAKFGWYENELPFYYEDVNTELVTQNLDIEETYKKLPDIKFQRVRTPYSTFNDNYRNHNVLVNILTDQMQVNFDARVELSGQFSTLTRGYYENHYLDPSVNELYNHKITDLGGDVKLISQDKTNSNTDFPFTANYHLKYEKNDVITKASDGTLHLNLSNWFAHIIYKNFNADNRKTDFYFDFQFQDTYKYFIKTDKAVAVVNTNDFTKEIIAAFGNYTITLSYPQPGIIQIESKMVVKNEIVQAKEVMNVAAVYQAIEQLNKKELVLKLQ